MQGGSSHTGESGDLLLEAERSGGAPGLFLRMRVDVDGAVDLHRPPAPPCHYELPPSQLATLRSQVAGAHFTSLSSAYFTARAAQPSGCAWRIRHGGRIVSTRDGEAPRGLGRLMRGLEAIIDEVELAAC